MSAPSPAGSSEPKTVGACPSCGLAPHPGLLYAQDGVPVQSCLQPASVAEARSIERRALQLRGCSGCGLVFNQAFDPATQRFDIGYEETQAFSPVFRAFADDLVDALVERWEPAGGLVVEIGCGKGDFLEVLCQRGNCRGLGIDPAFEPDRRPAVPGVAFEQRLFSSEDIGRPADFLVCRHTLEHIGPVGEFLRQVAEFCRAASVREVFFEVPDARRIAAEGAFWDVYYEHANYFDRGAFAAALEAAGLTVTMTQRLFHSQYLGLFATLEPERPVSRRAAPTDFSPWSALEQVRGSWQRRINEQPGPIVIWGSGSKGVAFLAGADPHGRVEAAVDINPHRQGRFMPGSGQPIIAPEVLADLQPATVVVMNPAYQEEIRAQLAELGLDPRIEILGPR
jgi:hypothetical protein